MPLTLTVNTGQAVQLGDAAVIRVGEKTGNRVKLTFYTTIAPIELITTGIIPRQFTTGITGERRILENAGPVRAVA